MNQVYRYLGYTKQAFHQKMDRALQQREYELLLLPIIGELREEHPGVAARQLYTILQPDCIGRDRFEKLCFENGFRLEKIKAYKRTTDSNGVIRFPNLIVGREFTCINQAWGSDITYYQIGETFYYLTFIIDLYSRVIVGFSVSKRLVTAETTLPALKMALQQRHPASGLIFHSDGGGQYYCKDFVELTSQYEIANSMCDVAYENPHAERINGTIKNQYLKGYKPTDFRSLTTMTKRAIYNYNWIRPHKSLNKVPPSQFEKLLPAGGSLVNNDNFCSFKTLNQRKQKNYHYQLRFKKKTIEVQKTVNVF